MDRELTPEEFLMAEKAVDNHNKELLKQVGERYGKKIAEEIEYEMFADAGSIGRASIVSEPKGECMKSQAGTDNLIKEAWSISEHGNDEETGRDYDVSFFFKLEEGKYFTYNSIL